MTSFAILHSLSSLPGNMDFATVFWHFKDKIFELRDKLVKVVESESRGKFLAVFSDYIYPGGPLLVSDLSAKYLFPQIIISSYQLLCIVRLCR